MNYLTVTLLLVAVFMGTNIAYEWPEYVDAIDYQMPDSCAETNYCFEKGSDYPDEKIAELLKDIRELEILNPKLTDNQFDDRQGDNSRGHPDCPAITTYEQPIYYIIDTKNKTRVVIQSPDKFQQIYSVERCKNEGRITYNTENFIAGFGALVNFNVTCVTTKMDFDFFVLNDDYDLKVEIAKAKGGIPVCCRCRYSYL